jgi:hypothetical protein
LFFVPQFGTPGRAVEESLFYSAIADTFLIHSYRLRAWKIMAGLLFSEK